MVLTIRRVQSDLPGDGLILESNPRRRLRSERFLVQQDLSGSTRPSPIASVPAVPVKAQHDAVPRDIHAGERGVPFEAPTTSENATFQTNMESDYTSRRHDHGR